ncbi:MAG: pyridoxal-phosphate dependent enzyme [Planctomycetota bacterium]
MVALLPVTNPPASAPALRALTEGSTPQHRHRHRHAVLVLIGNTPLVPLFFPEEELTIHAKAEFLNPTGSIKDPMAAMLQGEAPCCHSIEGVVGGHLPPLLDGVAIDAAEKVGSAEALLMTRRLAREHGFLVGTSSGANVVAALRVARSLPAGARVVTILCDRAERYFSTRLFAAEPGAAVEIA